MITILPIFIILTNYRTKMTSEHIEKYTEVNNFVNKINKMNLNCYCNIYLYIYNDLNCIQL